MTIQLFVPKFRVDECLLGIRECLERGWTGLGYKTVEFESAWKDYSGFNNAHFLSSNTVGLHLAVRIFKTEFGWQDGDEIITTPLTFVSTNHAIKYENLTPVFADIDETLCLDPADIKRKITPKTRAVIFVGIGGSAGKYEEVVRLCQENNLILILDAAHMAGTRLNGRQIGHDADCAVFSFQAVKNLPTADSGMICFADDDRDVRARKLSWLGINKDTYSRTSVQGAYKWMYDVEEAGYKYHGNSIMAAIGMVSLRYLDEDNNYRRRLAGLYEEKIARIGNPFITVVPSVQSCESSRHLFQIRVGNREEVIIALNARGINVGVHYRDNTEYEMYRYGANTCPFAHMVSKEVLSLPMHMGITEDDVDHVVHSLNDVILRDL